MSRKKRWKNTGSAICLLGNIEKSWVISELFHKLFLVRYLFRDLKQKIQILCWLATWRSYRFGVCVCETCRAELPSHLQKKVRKRMAAWWIHFREPVCLCSDLHFSILLYKRIPTSLLGFVHPLCSPPLWPQGTWVKWSRMKTFGVEITKWHWQLKEKKRLTVLESCLRCPSWWESLMQRVHWEQCVKTQPSWARKPANGEETIFLLKPWDEEHKAALRKEEP